jgi:hypothetical protein
MRVGYSYWGFLGDNKEDAEGNALSTPDGNATYSWSIIHECQKRGWLVYAMQEDRDRHAFMRHGSNFEAFSERKRIDAYIGLLHTNGWQLPELDVLLLEWRFPIFGRNCCSWEGAPCFPSGAKTGQPIMASGYADTKIELQPDLFRQYELLRYYKERGTKIIFWDLDHKVDLHSEEYWKPDAVFETSARPLHLHTPRTRVEFPTVVEDLLQFPTLDADRERKSVYIGSRYERDDVITEWLKPLSDAYPNQVEFWGNWLKTVDECRKLWPNVSYNDRITTKDFRKVYGTAGSVPLLGKKSYLQAGFVTPRPWEALIFGSIPVGLGSHLGIERYVLSGLIAGDGNDMIEVAESLCGISQKERHLLREENANQLSFMDARHFVDKIEDVANEVVDLGEDLRIEKEGA